MIPELDDHRAEFWSGSEWFDSLDEPRDGISSAWWLAKGDRSSWFAVVANLGLAYCLRRGLRDHFRRRFQSIPAKDVSHARAHAERRSASFPIWEILSELVAAAFVEGALGWRYASHEPPGHQMARGDWEFVTHEGCSVFIEVKTLGEWVHGEWVGIRPSYSSRLSAVLKRAYRQLPRDRPTLVIIVGTNSEILRMPFGLLHSDLFEAFFGRTIVRMKFDGVQATDPSMGPSFRNMFVQRQKHSRLGAAIALNLRGLEAPRPEFYGITNPFARPESALPSLALSPLTRFVVEGSEGRIVQGAEPEALWNRILEARLWRP